MKVAIVGSRNLQVSDFTEYLSEGTTEIVSGGAKGIDQCAAKYAVSHGLMMTEFKPYYRRYGRGAPLQRNVEIVFYADYVLIFWNGTSRGSRFVMDTCEKTGKPYRVILMQANASKIPPSAE